MNRMFLKLLTRNHYRPFSKNLYFFAFKNIGMWLDGSRYCVKKVIFYIFETLNYLYIIRVYKVTEYLIVPDNKDEIKVIFNFN